MPVRLPVAGIAAVLVACAPFAAISADLYGYEPRPGYRTGSPYEDPRYDDIYRHPTAPPPPPRYAGPQLPPPPPEPYYTAPPPPTTWRPPYAERREYLAPMPPPWAFRDDRRHARSCVPREVVRDELQARGWHDLHHVELRGDIVHLRARRPSGRLFDLSLDRCSGQVLGAHPVERHAEAQRYRDRTPSYQGY